MLFFEIQNLLVRTLLSGLDRHPTLVKWHGENSTYNVSSVFGENSVDLLFDDDIRSTFWVSKFGEEEKSSIITINFEQEENLTSIIIEFPNMYQNLPDLSVMAAGEELISWSLKTHFKNDGPRQRFSRAENRAMLIRNQRPRRVSDLRLVFSHECDYAVISDLSLEFATTLNLEADDAWTAELFINNQSTDLVKGASQLTYNLFAVGACEICNQNLYVRFDNDQGFDDVCRMFQLKSLTYCDSNYGLGIAKWQPWYDRADYRAVDTG